MAVNRDLPCATIVGKRSKDGGEPCGHALADHERHERAGFVFYVCRVCRDRRLRWTTEIEGNVAGADHWYADGYGG